MAFGMRMEAEYDELGILLRPFSKKDLPHVVQGFSSMSVHLYTNQLFAQPLESEEEWYERTRQSETDVVWAIVPYDPKPQVKKDSLSIDIPIGVTGIHRLDLLGSCVTGIVIWDTNWWGKGVATRAHLARTLFAADYLNRHTIETWVRAPNIASLKAVQKVGYILTGRVLRKSFRAGKFIDTYVLTWLHPEKFDLLYPQGLDGEYDKEFQHQIEEGLKRAQIALDRAREIVNFP